MLEIGLLLVKYRIVFVQTGLLYQKTMVAIAAPDAVGIMVDFIYFGFAQPALLW